MKYEEVDIGSDDEADEGATEFVPSTGKEKRSLPTYLQSRHDVDEDYPNQLPNDHKDGAQRARQQKKGPTNKPKLPTAPKSTTAGKRPSMRPSATNSGIFNDHEDAEDDEQT